MKEFHDDSTTKIEVVVVLMAPTPFRCGCKDCRKIFLEGSWLIYLKNTQGVWIPRDKDYHCCGQGRIKFFLFPDKKSAEVCATTLLQRAEAEGSFNFLTAVDANEYLNPFAQVNLLPTNAPLN